MKNVGNPAEHTYVSQSKFEKNGWPAWWPNQPLSSPAAILQCDTQIMSAGLIFSYFLSNKASFPLKLKGDSRVFEAQYTRLFRLYSEIRISECFHWAINLMIIQWVLSADVKKNKKQKPKQTKRRKNPT